MTSGSGKLADRAGQGKIGNVQTCMRDATGCCYWLQPKGGKYESNNQGCKPGGHWFRRCRSCLCDHRHGIRPGQDPCSGENTVYRGKFQDGDGIALAEGAGVALTPYCTLVKENDYSCNSRLDAPNRSAHQACSLWVNCYGERFHDESDSFSNESTNALVRQPGKIGYTLFDENIISTLERLLAEQMAASGPADPNAPADFASMQSMVINVFDANRLRDCLENE